MRPGALLLLCFVCHGADSGIGTPVGLQQFGRVHAEQGSFTVEWDEPREFRELIARSASRDATCGQIRAEYWVAQWPAKESRGGWTVTDDPWNGVWRTIALATAEKLHDATACRIRFAPLTTEENPNARNRPGYAPVIRVALKVRVTGPDLRGVEVLSDTTWNSRDVFVEGAGVEVTGVYNGRLLRRAGNRITVAYTEHATEARDGTVLSLRAGGIGFGVAMDDLVRERAMLVPAAGVFLTVVNGLTREAWLAAGRVQPSKTIRARVAAQPEQSLARATAEIPPLSKTANNGRHPVRYVPLAVPAVREKFGLEYNGNLFASKHGSKLFADELTRALWDGDKIRFRIGTGEKPDYREREHVVVQKPVGDDSPVIVSSWEDENFRYEEEAFAAVANGDAGKPWSLRGDETAVAMLRISIRNTSHRAQTAVLSLKIEPAQSLRLERGLVVDGPDRYRALVDAGAGILRDQDGVMEWRAELRPGAAEQVVLKIPYRTLTSEDAWAGVRALDFGSERERVLAWWSGEREKGMQIHIPDRPVEALFRSSLQHMLVSVQRDVPTGLYMLPCGTYDYNMYLNETNMQIRLLDMRGLHELAARFLEPLLRFQGSKGFPGKFQFSDGIFHGIRVDEQHDYTSWGYNLNHGWTLWTLAEHYRFTRDTAWLGRIRPNLVRGAEWIVRERKSTQAAGSAEYGLLPAGQLEDNEEWRHWFAVNAYAYRGLRAVADVLQDAALQREADAYRADLRAAVERSVALAPVAPRKDGTWIPVVPPRMGLHGRDLGWIRNILYGALVLIDCGVYSPDEPMAEWILDDLEDNLFLSADSLGPGEADWFSRGGITLQPNLVNSFVAYQARGEVKPALRAFYNSFAASYYPDVNAFTEWIPSFGRSGGPYYKTSDEAGFLAWLRLMLIREDGTALRLLSAAPRNWFRQGETVQVQNAATFFGKVSFRVSAGPDRMAATVELPQSREISRIQIRLPHPENRPIRRALVDGQPTNFDPDRETVSIPYRSGATRVEAFY